MPKVLKYFDVNGIAEGIRYILHYTGQKFEDVRYNHSEWPIKEVKDALPYSQFPLYEDDGRVLHQSLAIARYVAANTDILPKDPWEQAILDAAVLTVYDFHKNVVAMIMSDPETKQKCKTELCEEKVPFFFSRFEKQLKANNGYFGGKLSWADFIFVAIIECANLFLNDKIEKNYPTISQLGDRIRSLPGVKEYIKDRKPYKAW